MEEALSSNFENMDLSGIDFRGRNLSGANFAGANLEGACFIDATLVSANFEGANLRGADFSCAKAWSTNFNNTNCKNALFLSTDLTEASFEGADLEGTSFAQANLTEASLEDANIITVEFDNTIGIYPVCPTHGSFIGWTLAEDSDGNDCIVEVEIEDCAERNSGTTRRCRAEALHINSIERLKDNCNLSEATLKFRDYMLTEKKYVYDKNFEEDPFRKNSTDLYFWISKEEALAHAGGEL